VQIDQNIMNSNSVTQIHPDREHGDSPYRDETLGDGVGEGPESLPVASCEQKSFHFKFLTGNARRLRMGTAAFGDKYPTRTSMFVSVDKWIVHNRLGTLHVKAEGHLLNILIAHRRPNRWLILCLAI